MTTVILLVNEIAAQITQGCFEHIKDELRTRRAAGLTAAEFGAEELLVLRLGEVGEHFGGLPEEHKLPPLVEQEGFLEHLEDL